MTKEKIENFLECFDKLSLGRDDGDVGYKQESTRGDVLLVSVILVSLPDPPLNHFQHPETNRKQTPRRS